MLHTARVPVPGSAARRARGAVAALFFTNGALYANVVPRYPELKGDLELSNAAFGSAIAAYGLGALALSLLGGIMVGRWGSVRVAPLSVLATCVNLVLLGLAPSWLALAAVLFVAGALDSVADTAENAHGLRVERLYGRSILNSMHGVWSIGAVVGGSMAPPRSPSGLPLEWHLSLAAALFAALTVGVSRFLLPGLDDTERIAARGRGGPASPDRADADRPQRRRARGDRGDGPGDGGLDGATWGAVYLREDLGAAAAVGGLGFIALQTMQTVGRLLGDRVVTRYGDRAVARAGRRSPGGRWPARWPFPGR